MIHTFPTYYRGVALSPQSFSVFFITQKFYVILYYMSLFLHHILVNKRPSESTIPRQVEKTNFRLFYYNFDLSRWEIIFIPTNHLRWLQFQRAKKYFDTTNP